MLCIYFHISAQSIQMPKWPLNGKEIDFTTQEITVNDLGYSLPGACGATNGYYDQYNNRLFHIIDTRLYDSEGTYVDDLYTDEDNTPDQMGAEIIVVPAEPTNNCLYYVIYTIQQNNDDDTHVWKVCYNLVCWYGPTIVESGVLFTYDDSLVDGITIGSIAISDFIYDNNEVYHKLHVVAKGPLNQPPTNSYYINGELRLRVYSTISTIYGYECAELEMSKDGKVLAGVHLNPDKVNNFQLHPYNITIWILDEEEVPDHTYQLDIGTPNDITEQFTGIEIYQDPNNPNIKSIISSKVGGYKYFTLLNGNQIMGTQYIQDSYGYSNSQLELCRKNSFISTNNGTYIQQINTNNFQSGTTQIGTHNPIFNGFIYNFHQQAPTVYTLPDQVDQADYGAYTIGTEFDCCLISYTSKIKTAMSGVELVGDDIKITGSNVIWQTTSNPFTSGGQAITDIYLKGKIIIDKGAKLTLYGLTLHFREGESIDMENSSDPLIRGSQLYIISNSKLTVLDECDEDVLWDGINLVGYSGYTQQDIRQPKVSISSGSTIEFAERGIEVTGGGIVYAQLANFKDNIIDVKFNSYSSYGDNISYFHRCDFYTTNALYNKGYNPTYHAHIYNAPGLEFKGCDFYNTNYASVPYTQWGSGILSSLSSLEVKLYGTSTPSTFANLNYGIKASGGSYLTVENSNFTDCVRGAWLIANNAITATGNDFNVSTNQGLVGSIYDSFGLYIESSTGYQIEDNNFHDGLLGLVVYASGYNENLVYRNTFTDLSGNGAATGFVGIGINATSTNGKINPPSGLQLRCNEFIDVNWAMAILGGTIYNQSMVPVTVTQSNLRKIQGDNGSWISTYNYFEGIYSVPGNYRYFYVDGSVNLMDGPYTYNQTDVTGYRIPSGCYQTTYVAVNNLPAETCASMLGLYMASGIEDIISQTEDYQDYETYLQNELAEITNNSLSLFISAQSANNNNASEVYEQLSSSSPNLTAEVLLAYLDNPNVPELSKVSLMLENSPLPSDVVEAVEHSDLSPEYIDYILKHQEGVNEIEQLQNQIQGLQSARQVNYDHLMRATFNADTVASFAETYNYVMGFMETQTDYHAKNRLVDMYIKKGMFEKAMTLLNEMEQIAMSSENVAALNDIKLTEIKIDILQNINTEPILDIVKRYDEFLTELAADYNTKEGGVARAILESAGLMENFPIVFLPDPASEIAPKSAIINQPGDEQITNYQLKSLFKLYPNPANDYLSLEFINPNGNCTFNIYSIKGELLKTISTNQQLGFLSINISDLKPGNYIVNCVELQSNVNFVIAR